MDFTRDITVLKPCQVSAESWRELTLLKFEAERFARDLWRKRRRQRQEVITTTMTMVPPPFPTEETLVQSILDTVTRVWQEVEREDRVQQQENLSDGGSSNPHYVQLPYDPLQVYEDVRLELCARRYVRALVSARIRVRDRMYRQQQTQRAAAAAAGGGGDDARSGAEGPNRIRSLNFDRYCEPGLDVVESGKVRELADKLRREFPPVREVVGWVVRSESGKLD